MPQRSFQPDFLFSGGRVLSGAALNVREGTVVSTGAPEAGFARKFKGPTVFASRAAVKKR